MKMNATLTHIKVPLSQLKITTNVRQDLDEAEIAELAQSIRDNGLINAITVKPPVIDEHGDKTYEVIAGGRRIRAHQWLCEHGDDFSMIDCKISTGDMWTIQMVENIQRTDLSPREKEAAIIRAVESGMSQKEIAEKLLDKLEFMEEQLQILQKKLREKGWTEEYQNGEKQFGIKKSSEADVYNNLIKNYNATIKVLAELVPDSIDKNDPIESEFFR